MFNKKNFFTKFSYYLKVLFICLIGSLVIIILELDDLVINEVLSFFNNLLHKILEWFESLFDSSPIN